MLPMKLKIKLLNKTGFTLIIAMLFIIKSLTLSVFSKSTAVQFSVNLLKPIEFISQNKTLTESEREEILLSIKNISQISYDAFVFDNPLQSMWMDINKSQINVKNTGTKYGDAYLWKITSIQNTIPVLSNYSEPKKMTETLKKAVEGFSVQGETLFEKVRSIHDYVCNITTYDLNASHAYSAYGALVDGKSVCEGYAEAIKLLCDQAGIESILVFGTGVTSAGNDNHMWNYIKMDDGKWYALDATWDDGKKISEIYFLVGANTVVDNVTNTVFSQDHLPSGNISDNSSKQFSLPELSSESYLSNNPNGAASEAMLYAPYRYYYNQLSNEQKNYYNTLLSITPPTNEGVDSSTDTETDTDLSTTETAVIETTITETTVIDTTWNDDSSSNETPHQTSENTNSDSTTRKNNKNTSPTSTSKSEDNISGSSQSEIKESNSDTQTTKEPDSSQSKLELKNILRICAVVVFFCSVLACVIFVVIKFVR